MRIETKFNIGDEVWYYRRETHQAVMSKIDHILFEGGCIWYNLTNYESKSEDELFATEQELLDSLCS